MDYSGWKNRQTWNVALWINNDEGMYRACVSEVKRIKDKTGEKYPSKMYWRVLKSIGIQAGDRTPDNIAYFSTRLDYKALNEMMIELAE